jgi:hypothetical protein
MDGKRNILIVSFPHCIEEKAWKCIKGVTAFPAGTRSALLCHPFGKMQPGCNGENLQPGSSSFYPSKKKNPLNFHVLSCPRILGSENSFFFAKPLSVCFPYEVTVVLGGAR